MVWEPEQQHLGRLGLAGICLDILRVLLAILPGFDEANAFLLVAHVVVCGTFFSRVVSGGVSTLVHLIFSRSFFLVPLDFIFVEIYDCMFTLSVATLYRTKGSVRDAQDTLTKDKDMLMRHHSTLLVAVAVLSGCVAVSGDAWRALRLLHGPSEIVVALQLLIGSAACLAGTAYIALLCQLACAVSLLEDTSGLGAIRRSRALLAGGGMFWRAVAVFAVLDGSFVATLMTFPVAVWDEALGVGRVLQVALCAVVVVVTLVAQPVVYLSLVPQCSQELPVTRILPPNLTSTATIGRRRSFWQASRYQY